MKTSIMAKMAIILEVMPIAKVFIGNSKALHGTYFYIVRYSKRGKEEQQKGFLYVR